MKQSVLYKALYVYKCDLRNSNNIIMQNILFVVIV